jgi:hypothetical protein
MNGWIVQWKGYEPGLLGAVKVLVADDAWSSKAFPLSAVTVWAVPSSLWTVTVAPGLTDAGVWKAKPLMVITAAEAVVPAADVEDAAAEDEVEVEVDEFAVAFPPDDEVPQPARATANRLAATPRRIWALVPVMHHHDPTEAPAGSISARARPVR